MATTPSPFADASLEDLLALARKRFSIVFKPVRIGEQILEITHIENMTEYLEKLADQAGQGKGIELPMWAKIWPASTMLALAVTQIPVTAGKRILEVGAGLGIPGLVAAARGFTTVITDINEDALLFAQINILKNGLQHKATVKPLNIMTQDSDQPFDCILGSEVLYLKNSASRLVQFLHNSLKPKGMALFARDASRQENSFIAQAASSFDIGVKQVGYKPNPDEKPFQAMLYRLTFKNEVNAQ
jgi:predicted nicotinamide N-methyase